MPPSVSVPFQKVSSRSQTTSRTGSGGEFMIVMTPDAPISRNNSGHDADGTPYGNPLPENLNCGAITPPNSSRPRYISGRQDVARQGQQSQEDGYAPDR